MQEYLHKKGLDFDRLTAAGLGQYQPSPDSAAYLGWAEHRPTEMDLVPVCQNRSLLRAVSARQGLPDRYDRMLGGLSSSHQT